MVISGRYECFVCGQLREKLEYCSHCWNMVCDDCYDPYAALCKWCAEWIFKGRKLHENERGGREASDSGIKIHRIDDEAARRCPSAVMK